VKEFNATCGANSENPEGKKEGAGKGESQKFHAEPPQGGKRGVDGTVFVTNKTNTEKKKDILAGMASKFKGESVGARCARWSWGGKQNLFEPKGGDSVAIITGNWL